MEFYNVFKSLQELFPQIDTRLLRAVALEHEKDVDQAVEAVLEEIIPYFAVKDTPITLVTAEDAHECDGASGGSGQGTHNAVVERVGPLVDWYRPTEVVEPEPELTGRIGENNVRLSADECSGREPVVEIDDSGVSDLQIEVSEVPEVEGISTENCIETLSDNIATLTPENSQTVEVDVHNDLHLNQQAEDFDDCLKDDFDEENVMDGPDSLIIHDQMPSASSSNDQALPVVQENISENNEAILSSDDAASKIDTARKVDYIEDGSSDDAASKIDTARKVDYIEDGSRLDGALSQSNQIQIVNDLEEIISGARNNKKALFSSMESVMSLMREVENKERAAELAKEDASMGGISTQEKVEELDKMLQHAKAANDMHAGEVYGEKAILTTELRDLQSRVLSLSDSRDKSFAVLDEMRQTLEARLFAAENEIKLVEQEKLEKEKSARKALADQELIMEKVVQESKILKQQAEDNAKLEEFLLDRSRVVDVLQGEIAVIREDVMLLKEKLDERVPLSKSLSSSQTSFILSSSRSSARTLTIKEQVDPVPDQSESLATQEEDPVSSLDENVPIDKTTGDDREALQDDGWEIFDKRELQACRGK